MISVSIQVIVAMSVGIALGAIYLCTEDIISVIIAHFLIDTLGVIFAGGETTPYHFLAIFVALSCFEIVYGLLLVRKKHLLNNSSLTFNMIDLRHTYMSEFLGTMMFRKGRADKKLD